MSAQAAPGFKQFAFVEQVHFLIRQQRAEGVGIGNLEAVAAFLDGQPPGARRRQLAAPLEQASGVDLGQLGQCILHNQADAGCGRAEYTQGPAFRGRMQAKYGKRVVVAGGE